MNTIEKKAVKVGKYVSTEHVDNLIRNYKKERWIQNSERIGKEDSLGAWYSVEELEEFIQTAKMHGAEGIKIYFGVYGAGAVREELNGKQTIALVATSGDQENVDPANQRDMYITNNGKTSLLAYNWPLPLPGSTIPPTGVGSSLGITIAKDKNNRMVVI
jgi:hypothetical protein